MKKFKVAIFIAATTVFLVYALFDFNRTAPHRQAADTFAQKHIRESQLVLTRIGDIQTLTLSDSESDQLGKNRAYRLVYKLVSTRGQYTAYLTAVQEESVWQTHKLILQDKAGMIIEITNREK